MIGIVIANAAKFYCYPYFTFYLEEIFCAHSNNHECKISSNFKVMYKDVPTSG